MTNYGATLADWNHFDMVLGLTADLLPVVSNPNAVISPQSKMKALGKTPSMYYGPHVGGMKNWTQHQTTPGEITRWAEQPDYGICIQTRTVRAFDIDIDDPTISEAVQNEIERKIGFKLPTRSRSETGKRLQPFLLEGDYTKRTIRTDHGIIEFLATGQQFVAVGTHPSGSRYDWAGGLPEDIPRLSAEAFEAAWKHLHTCFGVGEATIEQPTQRHTKLNEAIENDPIAQHLIAQALVLSTERDGRLHITCPFAAEHTTDSADSGTTYFPARTGGYERGHFKCLHAHCAERTRADFLTALEYDEDLSDGFDEVTGSTDSTTEETDSTSQRYQVESLATLAARRAPEWIVKGVIPRATLGVIFGEPGSGKTFFALDIAMAVAKGDDWRGLRAAKGRVVYIAAEDVTGVQQRIGAYLKEKGIPPGDVHLGVLADAPNFMKVDDTKDVILAIRAFGRTDVVFVDTFAQVTPGANENSGEDIGKALMHCRQIHKHTGALVMLIHHSGKDSSKGARGWSGLQGAADCVIEVARSNDDREAIVVKQKNAADGQRYGFKLNVVTLGVDEDGDNITSCVVEHTSKVIDRIKKRALKPLEKLTQDVFDELSVGGPVERSKWVQEVKSRTEADPTAAKDQRTRDIGRAIIVLVETGYVEESRGFFTLVAKE